VINDEGAILGRQLGQSFQKVQKEKKFKGNYF